MVIVADSYMGMFSPEDIPYRITRFIAGSVCFPFIKEDEIMATFYLFGKDNGVNGDMEILAATDLTRRTIEQLSREIRMLHNMPNKMKHDFVRENYTRRALQVSIEVQNDSSFNLSEINKRIATDPTILTSCFTEHIAYYKQDYFFELFGPFKENQIPESLRKKLQGRMLLLGFNVEDSKSLPFENTLIPFINWIRKTV
ncbi:MAG: hypothetical protein WB443_14765 [Nitrososphaeraceae archaeon]